MESEKAAIIRRIREKRKQKEARDALKATLGHKKDVVELTDGCGTCADAREELRRTQKELLDKRKFRGFNEDDKTASGVDI